MPKPAIGASGWGATLNAFLDTLVVSVEDYGAVGDGVTNETTVIQTAINAATTAGRTLFLPRGRIYLISNTVNIPTGARIYGHGATIKITGINGTNVYPTLPSPGTDVYNAFQIPAAGDVEIYGLRFLGQNDPFVYRLAHQAGAIDIAVNNTGSVVVQDCKFEYLHGYTVHAQLGTAPVHVRNCTIKNTGGTVNVNSDGSHITGNSFDTAATIETSASHGVVSGNTSVNCPHSFVIALGGRVTGAYGIGTVCKGNVIKGADGSGISIADGTQGYAVTGNTVYGTAKQGIIAVGGTTNKVKNLVIGDNAVVSCGLTANPANDRYAIYVGENTENVSVVGNRVGDAALSGHQSHTGIYAISTTGLFIAGNAVAGTSNLDISCDSCGNVLLGANLIATVGRIASSGTTVFSGVPGGPLVFPHSDGPAINFSTTITNPESALSSSPGGVLVTTAGGIGSTLFTKESGFSNTGWVPLGGSIRYSTKTANYTISGTDQVIIGNGTSITITLPDPTTVGGRVFIVKNVHSTSLTVVSAGTSKTIDGAASVALAQWAAGVYISDNTQWLTV